MIKTKTMFSFNYMEKLNNYVKRTNDCLKINTAPDQFPPETDSSVRPVSALILKLLHLSQSRFLTLLVMH